MKELILSLPRAGPVDIRENDDSFTVKRIESIDDTNIIVSNLPDYLIKRSVIVLDSVFSGNRSSGKNAYTELVMPLLNLVGVHHKYIKTTSSHSIADFGSALIANGHYTIILISGDTSISELINNVPDSCNIILLTLIQGTGNAFANSIDLSTVLDGIKALFCGKVSRFPLYKAVFDPPGILIDAEEKPIKSVNSMIFFVVGSWCLHASLVADSAREVMRQKYGMLRFRKSAEKILDENPPFPGSIYTTDGQSTKLVEKECNLSYFLVAALPRFEPTFLISPDSDPMTKQLHLLYFKYTDSANTMKIMNEAYDHGAHIHNPAVRYFGVSPDESVVLQLSDEVIDSRLSKICIDGSIILMKGQHRKITFSCSEQNHQLYYLS